jgi:hypothetical protein
MSDDYVNRYNRVKKRWERVPKTSAHEPGVLGAGKVLTPLTTTNSVRGQDDGHSTPSYRGGSARSVSTLNHLRFDPIEELVQTYRRLQEELDWHETLRDGDQTFTRPNGTTYSYSSDAHMKVYERVESISKELLRYGYGRVPENADMGLNRNATLVVNLTTKGDKFVINANDEEEDPPLEIPDGN